MDDRLHQERQASSDVKPIMLTLSQVLDLPNGAMVEVKNRAYAVREAQLFPWDFHGYGLGVQLMVNQSDPFRLLTPVSTVAALRRGYSPVWHSSAAS